MTARERTWPSFFAFDVADYRSGTQLFTCREHGLYDLMLLAQFESKELQAIPASKRDLKVICKGETPTARVLAKFERLQIDGQPMLRNRRMAKEAAIAVREWERAKERRRRWRARQRGASEEEEEEGTGQRTESLDRSGDGSRDRVRGRSIEREREREGSHRYAREPSSARAARASVRSVSPERPHASPAPLRRDREAAVTSIDYDPSDELQCKLAGYCERLAQLEAEAEGRNVEPGDPLRILQSVSVTPNGSHLDGLRSASKNWLALTLKTCAVFERDFRAEHGLDPESSSGEGNS